MKLTSFGLAALLFCGPPAIAAEAPYPFQDPSLPVEQRITNILSLMTLDEKIGVLGTNSGVPRLQIPNAGNSEGLHGLVQRNAFGFARAGTHPHHAVRAGGRHGPDLGPGAHPSRRRGAGRRGPLDLQQRREVQALPAHRLGPERRSRARSAVGPHRRVVRRRRVPHGHPVRRPRARHAGRPSQVLAGGVPGQALPREQQRERPLRLELGLRRAAAARVLLRPVSHGVRRGRRPLLHGVLQRVEPRADDDPPHAPGGGGPGVGRRRHRLDRRRRRVEHGPQAQVLREPEGGRGRLHPDRRQPVPRQLPGRPPRGARREARHRGRGRRGAPRQVPHRPPSGPARPARDGALREERLRRGALAVGGAQGRRPAGGPREHRAPQERGRPAAARPRHREVDRGLRPSRQQRHAGPLQRRAPVSRDARSTGSGRRRATTSR